MSFYLRPSHLDALADVIRAPDAGENEKFVCGALLKNAMISAEQVLPLCQDTGTATVVAWKGEQICTGADDSAVMSEAIAQTYRDNNLRYSQLAPLSMFEEHNTGDNTPAQIEINATDGGEYHFLCVAKGAGSANKTIFLQETRSLLTPENLRFFLREKIEALGADACPPYNIAVVIGGTSPEYNLKIQKLATTGWLDPLPTTGDRTGRAFRDTAWENEVLSMAADTGVGAQFGGRRMAIAARVIRLPRHGGSCPVSVGVSCSAHRNIIGTISKDGVFLEELDKNPSRLLDVLAGCPEAGGEEVNLDRPVKDILAQLQGKPPGALLFLNGPLVVARDLAHARIFETLREGGPLPAYMKQHPVCYAGPAKRPDGYAVGSFGPTTSRRMDGYLDTFMQHGASLLTLGKGSRSQMAAAACRRYGGLYLGTIGGAAALIAAEHITESEVIDFPEFGMEAVHRIKVKNLPAFVLCNDEGERFYEGAGRFTEKTTQ